MLAQENKIGLVSCRIFVPKQKSPKQKGLKSFKISLKRPNECTLNKKNLEVTESENKRSILFDVVSFMWCFTGLKWGGGLPVSFAEHPLDNRYYYANILPKLIAWNGREWCCYSELN